MPAESQTLFTASVLAKELGVSDAKVKKAIKDLNIVATAKKGCCNCYSQADLDRLRGTLK